jgi:hypothetical protein
VTKGELIALGAAIVSAFVAWRVFQWGLDRGDPRRAVLRAIRNDANAAHDIVIVPEDAREISDQLAPLATVPGNASTLNDLSGFRRLYVIARGPEGFVPYEARLGTATRSFDTAARSWDLAGIANVRFDITAELADHVHASRDGGVTNGPCVRDGAILHCHSPDDWNHLRVEEHPIGGTMVRCLFAHPQADSRLVIEVPDLPPARFLVGIYGIDDRGYSPAGAPVRNQLHFEPRGGGPAIERELLAVNKRGENAYRVDLGNRAGALRFTITTPNAGARQYCFTAFATQ